MRRKPNSRSSSKAKMVSLAVLRATREFLVTAVVSDAGAGVGGGVVVAVAIQTIPMRSRNNSSPTSYYISRYVDKLNSDRYLNIASYQYKHSGRRRPRHNMV